MVEWYSARIFYEFVDDENDYPDRPPEPLFEERLFVFSTDDGEDTLEKLTALAKKHESNFENGLGNMVAYTFREILEVQDITPNSIEDGTEVFYRFWHSPSESDFEIMRKTHTGNAWWKAQPDQDEKRRGDTQDIAMQEKAQNTAGPGRAAGPEFAKVEWYSARILYERLIDEDDDKARRPEALFEERLFVFSSDDGEDTLEKLAALAKGNEEGFDNVYGNRVTYVLKEILEVQDITPNSIEDGTEVFYRFWSDPSESDFEMLRTTHTGDTWWKAQPDQDAKP